MWRQNVASHICKCNIIQHLLFFQNVLIGTADLTQNLVVNVTDLYQYTNEFNRLLGSFGTLVMLTA